MKVIPCLFQKCRPLKPFVRCFLIAVMAGNIFPNPAAASDMDVLVTKNLSGKVIAISHSADCLPICSAEELAQSLVSLFALPNRGYVFQNWEGTCKNTIGPLCTLKQADMGEIKVHFSKNKAPKKPTKALLLLHDTDSSPMVWNEFVRHRFNNRCPLVYGGVVMGEDAFDSTNNVHCYRIRFGYYDALHTSDYSAASQASSNVPVKKATTPKTAGHEIRAAVLGLLNRHPDLSLTLVAQTTAAPAVQSFLQTSTATRAGFTGLLVLKEPDDDKSPLAQGDDGKTPALTLEASLKKTTKISHALEQLTKSWWIAQ